MKTHLDVVFILGRPGSGKGVQCSKICEEFKFKHLSAGELLRQARADGSSKFKRQLDEHFNNGTMVAPFITVAILKETIEKLTNKNNRFLIDGFPPNQENYEEWTKEMNNFYRLSFVLYLDVPQEICLQRCLTRGRGGTGRFDDTKTNLEKRFQYFTHGVLPVIEKFEKEGILRRVEGNESVDVVFDRLKECFGKFDD